ncbi:hypothetical protein B6U74_02815, partial [Candidatus Bathyarchaeota archaeon ex4484_205]
MNPRDLLKTLKVIYLFVILSLLSLFTLTLLPISPTNLVPTYSRDEGCMDWQDVIIADVDMDGEREIVAVGNYGTTAYLGIYDQHLNRETLITVQKRNFYGVNVGDYDEDGNTEIAVCGSVFSHCSWYRYVCWYTWTGSGYTLEYEVSSASGILTAISQPVDIDNDGVIEYVDVGIDIKLCKCVALNKSAVLSKCVKTLSKGVVEQAEYTGSSIQNVGVTYLDMMYSDLKVGQFDSNPDYEIVVVGATISENFVARIFRVISPDVDPISIVSHTWHIDTDIYFGVDVDKIDSDDFFDIVAVGGKGLLVPLNEAGIILEWTGSSLTELSKFYHGSSDIIDLYYDVYVYDIDSDSIREIIIVGDSFDYPGSDGQQADIRVCCLSGSNIVLDSGLMAYYVDSSYYYNAVDAWSDIIVVVGNSGIIRIFKNASESTTTTTSTTTSSATETSATS